MKQSKVAMSILTLGSAFLFVSCAHHETKLALDQKLQTEPTNLTTQTLNDKAEDLIKNSPDLTVEQRNQLVELHNKTHDELYSLREQSLKLRDILITDLGQTKYNTDEVSQVKKRLKKVEEKRLNVVFNAVDKASQILGHNHTHGTDIMRALDEVPDHSR